MNRVKFVTGVVRFTNVNVYQPISFKEGTTPKYGMTLLIPKSNVAEIERINRAYADVKNFNQAYLNGSEPVFGGLRDGDIDGNDPHMVDYYFLNIFSREKPKIIDKDMNPIIDRDALYNGYYGRVSVTLYPLHGKAGSGIIAELNNILKLKDGDRILGTGIEQEFQWED